MRGGVAQQYYAALQMGQTNSAFSLNDQIRGINGAPTDFWLEELRFGALIAAGVTYDVSQLLEFGLKVGRLECCAGGGLTASTTVPIPASAKSGFPYSVRRPTPGTPINYFTTVIRFEKPVYVPGNQRLLGSLRFASNGPVYSGAPASISTLNAWMTACGRRAEANEKPDVIHVPWFSAWRTPNSLLGTGAIFQYRSPDHALANGNDEPIHVQRMLGAIGTGRVVGEVIPATVRISDSDQKYIVRDATPLFELFSFAQRDWDMGIILKPHEFLNVEIELDTSPLVSADNFASAYGATDEAQAMFGLVGHRVMQFHDVYEALPEVAVAQKPQGIARGPEGLPVKVALPPDAPAQRLQPWWRK